MKDAGIVTIYTLTNTGEAGDMPKDRLVPATDSGGNVLTYQFEERVIGYGRQYEAMGVNERVDMLIRIWRCPVRIGMYAVLTDYEGQENTNGDQYRIDNVQNIYDDDGLKVTDLTLYRMDQLYEVIEPEPETNTGCP